MDYKKRKIFFSICFLKIQMKLSVAAVASSFKSFNHCNTSQTQLDAECVQNYKFLEISIQCKHQFDRQ